MTATSRVWAVWRRGRWGGRRAVAVTAAAIALVWGGAFRITAVRRLVFGAVRVTAAVAGVTGPGNMCKNKWEFKSLVTCARNENPKSCLQLPCLVRSFYIKMEVNKVNTECHYMFVYMHAWMNDWMHIYFCLEAIPETGAFEPQCRCHLQLPGWLYLFVLSQIYMAQLGGKNSHICHLLLFCLLFQWTLFSWSENEKYM